MNVISHPENEVYLKQKLCQSLSSFKGVDIIQRKNIPCCPLTILKGDKRCDSLKENGVKLNQSLKNGVIPIETSLPENEINLNEVQNHSNVAIPQSNQQTMKSMETGQSTYVPTMDNMEMFKNRHERSHLQSQNGILPWINQVSTTFHPFYTNGGFLRGCTAMTQVNEQPIKLSNSMQVSSHVPTGWRLQNVEKSNPKQLSIAKNTTFRQYNLQNNCNHENRKHGQNSLGSPQKGKTISDLNKVNPMRVKDMSTKGTSPLNPYFSEGMSSIQLSKYQERPFIPYNIHPSFLMHGNPSIYNGFLMPHHQLKDFSSVFMGSFIEVQVSRQHVSYFKDQGACLRSQEKKRKANALEQLGGRKLQQLASSIDLLNTTRDFGSKSDLMQDDDISKILDVGGYSTPATVLPIINIPKKDPPYLFNQNPADIADADDKRYFRTVEHQRIQDKSSIAGYSGVDVKLDDQQKKRRKERLGRMSVVGLKR
ncbi:hypothetical protein H5410_022452 [Solanum commersonii]|uniref:Uncharacterized protein n=1 Tax=Solanum commersonii TaxID=4109 RepID=A0A9J5ZE13_SOLCO|nr:hypothetical protein H5410_022452 [Solanum commersonii]